MIIKNIVWRVPEETADMLPKEEYIPDGVDVNQYLRETYEAEPESYEEEKEE